MTLCAVNVTVSQGASDDTPLFELSKKVKELCSKCDILCNKRDSMLNKHDNHDWPHNTVIKVILVCSKRDILFNKRDKSVGKSDTFFRWQLHSFWLFFSDKHTQFRPAVNDSLEKERDKVLQGF